MSEFHAPTVSVSDFFELSLDMMCVATPAGEMLAFNPAFVRAYGYTEEELYELNYWHLVHPDDVASLQAAMERLAAGEPMVDVRFRTTHKDGHYIHSEWTAQPRDGLLYAVGRDIGERLEHAKKLALADNRHEALARIAPVGIYMADGEGNNIFTNARLAEIAGLPLEQCLGKEWMQLIHHEDMPNLWAAWSQGMTAPEFHFDMKYRLKLHDGTVRWVRQVAERSLDADGKPLGFIGVIEDISEHMHAQQQIEEAKQRYETLARLAPVGIFMTDMQGAATFRNDRLLKITGQSHEEALGDGWVESIHPDDRQGVLDKMQGALSRLEPGEGEYRILRPDGAIRWAHAVVEPVRNDSDEPIGFIGVVEDITERVLAHNALEAERTRFETLAKLAPAGIFRTNRDGACTYVNDYLARLMGLPAEEVLGDGWIPAVHADDRDHVVKTWSATASAGSPYEGQFRYQQPDGTIRWVNVMARPELTEDNKVDGYIGVIVDVTEHKRMVDLLHETGRIARVGGWELDARTMVPTFSTQVNEIVGAPPDLTVDLESALQVYPRTERTRIEVLIKDAITNGKSLEYESEICTLQGGRRWVQVVAEPELEQGRVVRLTGVMQDITDRILAQQAESESNEKLRLLVERAPLGIVLHRMDGAYVQANEAYCQIIGCTQEQLSKLNHYEHVSPEFIDATEEKMRALMRTGSYGPLSKDLLRCDGSPVPVVTNGVLVKDDLGEEFVWCIVENVSLAREVEAARAEHQRALYEANNALQVASRELEEFTYAASHDLKEPLRTIAGFCDLLEEDLATNPEAAQEDLRVIKQGASRMQRLVGDLLALSRSGKQTLKIEAMPLELCFTQARNDLSALIEGAGAIVECGPLPAAMFDLEHMSRVFQNLISNAIKYQPKGAKPVVRISAQTVDGMCEVHFQDNGIGIDKQFHDKIFGAFKRLHGQQEYEGSGIGLAICRKTVERHGGAIRVESEPGRGSTFIVTLPLANANEVRNE